MNKLLIAAFLFGGVVLVPAATFAQTVTVSLDATTLGSTSVSPGTAVPFTAVRLTVNESQATISAIQVVSDSVIASQALTNFRVYDSGTPITSTYAVNLTFDGQQYQYWLNFNNPLVIPAGGSRTLTLYADVKPLSPGGTVRLGAGGLSLLSSGFAGWFPVYGNNVTISSFTPNIEARSPNGGETWTVGGTGVITWSIGIGVVPSVWNVSVGGYPDVAIDLYRFRDNQYQFVQSLADRHSGGVTAALPVPSVPVGNDYRIRVSAVGGSNIGATIFDFSDASFTISSAQPTGPAVTVLSPNGGETWTVGQWANVTWRRNWMPSGANGLVDITAGRESALSSQVIAGGVADSAGFSFVVPSWLVPANDYRITIGSWGTGGSATAPLSDESDGAFSVVAGVTPTLTLLSPTRNEYINRGGPYTVRWSTSGTLPADASMLLYLVRNSVSLGRVSSSAVGAGINSYVWDTSAYFLEGSGAAQKPDVGSYQIKAVLQSGGVPVTTALSEQFSLADQIIRSVGVATPNGGEQWQKGSVQTIQWGSSNVYDVVIYLLRGSGIVRTIADIATNPSQYRWTIPADIPDGSDYRVRVVDPSSGIFDDSDKSFTIAARQPGGAPLISDGSLIRARGYAEVWIVKGGYRRHIISPRVFTFYGHLGFAQVIDVEVGTVNQYTESRLIRAIGDRRVYELKPNGQKRWLNMYANQFLEIGHSPAEIYDVNAAERNFYATGPDLTPADFGIGR